MIKIYFLILIFLLSCSKSNDKILKKYLAKDINFLIQKDFDTSKLSDAEICKLNYYYEEIIEWRKYFKKHRILKVSKDISYPDISNYLVVVEITDAIFWRLNGTNDLNKIIENGDKINIQKGEDLLQYANLCILTLRYPYYILEWRKHNIPVILYSYRDIEEFYEKQKILKSFLLREGSSPKHYERVIKPPKITTNLDRYTCEFFVWSPYRGKLIKFEIEIDVSGKIIKLEETLLAEKVGRWIIRF